MKMKKAIYRKIMGCPDCGNEGELRKWVFTETKGVITCGYCKCKFRK